MLKANWTDLFAFVEWLKWRRTWWWSILGSRWQRWYFIANSRIFTGKHRCRASFYYGCCFTLTPVDLVCGTEISKGEIWFEQLCW
jgi:hypothetical protein